ncbi:MAG: alpha/beta hydrolase [Pseudomonadota bacterium]
MVAKGLLRFGTGALLLWAGLVAAMVAGRHTLIYPFVTAPERMSLAGLPGAQAQEIRAEDGTPLLVWTVAPAPGRPVVLHVTGNRGALASSRSRLALLLAEGYGVAALVFRGAGGQPGMPSETALGDDITALYDRLDRLMPEPVPADRRIAYGISLGAAVAVHLAAERPVSALVLEAPFARLCEVAEHRFPFVPACLLLWDERWPSADRIAGIGAPVLILHGADDRTIPLSQAEALFAAAAQPKRLIVYPDGGHNDLRSHGVVEDILGWLGEIFDAP